MTVIYTTPQIRNGTGFRRGTRFIEIGLPGYPEVSVCTALRDIPGQKSAHIGVFLTEDEARAACQEDKDEDDETSGLPKSPLTWTGDTAGLPDGESYVVIMTTLGTRTGLG